MPSISLAVTEEHQALADVAQSFLQGRGGRGLARGFLDGSAPDLGPLWAEVSSLGWPGIHLPEEYGGQGFGLPELAVVLQELGRVVAPLPLLETAVGSAVINALGTDEQRARLLPSLADGTKLAAVALGASLLTTAGRISGDADAVPGAASADLILIPLGEDLVVVPAEQAEITPIESLDPTRPLARVSVRDLALDAVDVLAGGLEEMRTIAQVLASAEASGGAAACVDMAVEYAQLREQFGRTIGTFQAVKHHCANMRVSAELANALAWDAARTEVGSDQAELVAAAAATVALPGYERNARLNIQLHGGIGFTWEHDAHLFLRRSAALRALFGSTTSPEDRIVSLAAAGVRRSLALELPAEAEIYRSQVREFLAKYATLDASDQRRSLTESGYLMPHWPQPYGRGAGPVEQLVIEEEFRDIELPSLGIGGWVVLTLVQHGTESQRDRWIEDSLAGDLRWCQLFSEPSAGSDSASVRTRAVRVDGGWRVTGQKIWTSGAQDCNVGLATVRTDPDAPKHRGITAMVIDMEADGVEVRPLREITGNAMFNEVFLDDVFVPDEDVVGEVNEGWKVARATLGNERVAIGAGSRQGLGAHDLLPLLDRYAAEDVESGRTVGRLIAQELAMRLLNVRSAARAVSGGGPGAEGNITKLLSAEHAQQVTEAGMRIAGPSAVAGGEAMLAYEYLFDRCLSIAGGTSEITRNVIAERILGLPRDPLLQ